MLNTLALVAISGFELFAALCLLHQILVVIASVEEQLLVPDLDGFLHRDIEKVAIVRDQQECKGILVQVLFQPVARFKVQVVGGFVEKKQVGFLEQQFGEGNPHLPAARELVREPRPIFLAKAKTG